MRQKNASLKIEIAELKARINSNSNNSSKPPSSDGYKKKPAFPRAKNGKQGGQKGHKGRTLKQVEKTEEIIKSKVAENNVVHADETGVRVEGRLHWLHTATTLLHTYLFVHEKRGTLALTSNKSILDRIKGWHVHDCWSSYSDLRNLSMQFVELIF